MTDQPTVNRYLKDTAFDHIDHALGRPVNPLRESYRNRFVIDVDAPDAAAFRASPNWTDGREVLGTLCFHVTDHGRRALYDHLRHIGERHRHFVVTWNGSEIATASKSHSAAKYDVWLDVSDAVDIPFGEFLKTARVRLAA